MSWRMRVCLEEVLFLTAVMGQFPTGPQLSQLQLQASEPGSSVLCSGNPAFLVPQEVKNMHNPVTEWVGGPLRIFLYRCEINRTISLSWTQEGTA